jgi:hypothetical protein
VWERFFDEETSPDERARLTRELASDPEAARYLEKLRRLRQLALKHDPGAMRPADSRAVPPWELAARLRRRWIAAGAAIAAGLVLAVWSANSLHRRVDAVELARSGVHSVPLPPRTPPPQVREESDTKIAAPAELDFDARSYAWANGEAVQPAEAARAVLASAARGRGRAPAEVEILAIELANAPPELAPEVGRIAAERKSLLRPPVTRPRAAQRPNVPGPSSGRVLPSEPVVSQTRRIA